MCTTTSDTPDKAPQGARDYAPVIRKRRRADILGGRLIRGSPTGQAEVSADFGVGRGLVREAFRLLERDVLAGARVNHHAHIAGLSVDDLEHLYAPRVVNESLALSVSTSSFSTKDLDERFHTLLLAPSGPKTTYEPVLLPAAVRPVAGPDDSR